jgi:hypothetical protein
MSFFFCCSKKKEEIEVESGASLRHKTPGVLPHRFQADDFNQCCCLCRLFEARSLILVFSTSHCLPSAPGYKRTLSLVSAPTHLRCDITGLIALKNA